MPEFVDILRPAMRHWTSGVTVVSSLAGGERHGLTANSLASISLEPALIVVTLNNASRTYGLVMQSRILGVTILAQHQVEIAERFAGRLGEEHDRFEGLQTFTLKTGASFIAGGLAFLDCEVLDTYPMPSSTMMIARVVAGQVEVDGEPLVYHNRAYQRMQP